MKNVIIIGAGGHAKVLQNTLKLMGRTVLHALEEDQLIQKFSPDEIELVNGIGSIKNVSLRKKVFEKFTALGYQFAPVIHPTATIANDVTLGVGVQIMAGAILQSAVHLADNVLINTGAILDHECIVGNHCHIATGAVFSGKVTLQDNVHIGTGSIVIQGITIGENSILGAGSVVYKNIPPGSKVYGTKIISSVEEF